MIDKKENARFSATLQLLDNVNLLLGYIGAAQRQLYSAKQDLENSDAGLGGYVRFIELCQTRIANAMTAIAHFTPVATEVISLGDEILLKCQDETEAAQLSDAKVVQPL